MYKVGDIVKAKKGTKDPDWEHFDISGWQGEIIEVKEPNLNDDEFVFLIKWDNPTLNQMSDDVLERAAIEGLKRDEMYLYERDFESAIARPDEKLIEREIQALLDEEKLVVEIIGDRTLKVNKENLEKFREFLNETFDLSTVLTGIEDFTWEERYVFGNGDKAEYKRLKKVRPSYRDLFKMLKVEDEININSGLIARVKRLSDRKIFSIPLADLMANDEKSDAYPILDAYSVWITNYIE